MVWIKTITIKINVKSTVNWADLPGKKWKNKKEQRKFLEW